MSQKPATTDDAKLILKLYDLRRESRMRQARDYCTMKFFPATYDDILKVMNARGADENAFLRQVTSYWDMAASFVVHGALNGDLFFDACAEMWLIYSKFKPFLPQLRKDYSPNFFKNIETVAEGTEQGRARVELFTKRMEAMKAAATK